MEAEVTLFNKTKNQYLYIQDNQSDEDCDTEYTVYDIYGNDQDGGLLSAESYNLETDQEVIAWVLKELKWTQDEVVKLNQEAAGILQVHIQDWEGAKIEYARKFMTFKTKREAQWEKL